MKRILSILVLLCAISVLMHADESNVKKSGNTRHYMKIEMGKASTDNTDNVLRVSCALVGFPHTSSRIDSVTAVIKGRGYKATDIDGVDFNRYFQWEDEDAIEVEIDFPTKSLPVAKDSIFFHTVHGLYKAPLK